jgi:SET domain-containing protein
MLAPLFNLKKTKGKGYGLFAKRDIPKGTVVFYECSKCKVIPKARFEKMGKAQKEKILFHAYTRKDGSVVHPCGDSIYMNHSCDPNVLDTGKGFDIVVKDIKKGQEATYDYRVFYDKDWGFQCQCGARNCCGTFTCRRPLAPGVRTFWDKMIKPALKLIPKVPQPIKERFLAEFPRKAGYFK